MTEATEATEAGRPIECHTCGARSGQPCRDIDGKLRYRHATHPDVMRCGLCGVSAGEACVGPRLSPARARHRLHPEALWAARGDAPCDFARSRAWQRRWRRGWSASGGERRPVDGRAALRALGLEPGADAEAIGRAFRERARALHPDAPTGDAAKFIELTRNRDAALAAVGA